MAESDEAFPLRRSDFRARLLVARSSSFWSTRVPDFARRYNSRALGKLEQRT
jgi:hypothetical protein